MITVPGTVILEGNGDAHGNLLEDLVERQRQPKHVPFQCALHSDQRCVHINANPQGLHVDGLANKVHSPERQPADLVLRFIIIRQHKGSDATKPRVPPKCLQHLESVHHRHAQIQQDELDVTVRFQLPHGVQTIGGGHNIIIPQHLLKDPSVRCRIINHKDMDWLHVPSFVTVPGTVTEL